MYKVMVSRKDRASVEQHTLYQPYGEWDEIGFWLDDNGYNSPEYRVVITFEDDEA